MYPKNYNVVCCLEGSIAFPQKCIGSQDNYGCVTNQIFIAFGAICHAQKLFNDHMDVISIEKKICVCQILLMILVNQ